MSNTIKARVNPKINNSSFNTKYMVTNQVFDIMSNILIDQNFMDDYNYLFTSPSDFFISVRAYPFNIKKYFNLTTTIPVNIRFGKTDLTYQGSNVKAPLMPEGSYYKHIGTYRFERLFDNFLDYNPYTKIELYLPFASIVTLDTNVVMGKEIRIFLSVDFDTGGCTYYIINHIGTNDDELIMSVNGQIGFEIPFGSSNANENAKQMLSLGLSTIGGIVTAMATENPMPVLMALGMSTSAKAFQNLQMRVQKGGGVGGKQMFVSPFNAYLIITTPKPQPIDYAHEKGRPLMKTMRLGDLVGFTRVTECHLDGFAQATTTELNELTNLLNDGIIL